MQLPSSSTLTSTNASSGEKENAAMGREDARNKKIESAAQKAETANPDLIRLALEWRDRYGYRFRLTHIYAHTGGSDERSVKNHKVGRLAVAGANKYGQIQGVIPVQPSSAGTPPSSPARPPPAPHLFGSPLPSPSTD